MAFASTRTDPALVVFDCDGVLIDSEIIACRVDAEELNRVGFPITVEEVAERFCGVVAKEMYAIVEEEHGRPLPNGFQDRVHRLIHEAFETELKPIGGVHETLDRIQGPVCVASSSGPEWLERSLTITALHDRFAPHVFSAHFVARGKPAPDIFLYAAAQMGGVDPADCVVIEDSISGVRAGVAAGMRVLGFTGGGHCAPGHGDRLRAQGAELVFDDMTALPDILRTA